jgi:acetaldehyde dehydrogenase (acetylating)
MAFGIEKPAFRILVNTWGTLGATGKTTGLAPSFTLAPGGVGGAVVSDNITLKHVLNIKRLAYHLHDAPPEARAHGGVLSGTPVASQQSANPATVEAVVAAVLAKLNN